MVEDITERKRLEEELELINQIYLSSSEAMAVIDANQLVITVNPAFTQITGYATDEVIGKNLSILRSGLHSKSFYRAKWLEINTTGHWQGEVLHRRKNGEVYAEWLTINTIHNEDGTIRRRIALFSDVSKIQEAQQQAQELLRQNRLLTKEMLRSLEMERHHISRELHDELGQWLTAIQAEATAIRGSAVGHVLIGAHAISDSAVKMHEVIRRIVRRLRPSLLDSLGLEDSLRELVALWGKRHAGISCELSLEGDFNGLGDAINITVYRVVQEALNNVAKHADATRVQIKLSRKPEGELCLTVKDNGVGMDIHALTDGIGLLGMRERVIAMDGEFNLRSTPGYGVTIEVGFEFANPLRRENGKS